MKKLLEKQLKDAPPAEREMITALMEKDPELFAKIAKEMQEELKKNGNNQMAAAMKIMPKYQKDLLGAMSPEMRQKLMQSQGGAAGRFNPNGSLRR